MSKPEHPFIESKPGKFIFDPLVDAVPTIGRIGHEQILILYLKIDKSDENIQSARFQCRLTVDEAREIANGLLEYSEIFSGFQT